MEPWTNSEKSDHKVDIQITGNYQHGEKAHASVSISGNGDLDHMIKGFNAILCAAGFTFRIEK